MTRAHSFLKINGPEGWSWHPDKVTCTSNRPQLPNFFLDPNLPPITEFTARCCGERSDLGCIKKEISFVMT
ncbi:unnamed protein product [Brassica oleracea var. botrytis]